MKKIGIIAHFGFGKNLSNGQTIKARILLEVIENRFGKSQVETIDTHGGIKRILGVIPETVDLIHSCENIIILPADKGLRLFLPLIDICNWFCHRKLFHVVIGGWLPEFLSVRKRLANIEKKYNGIYVETETMKVALEKQGFKNIYVLPNCKILKKITKDDLRSNNYEPFSLCTFSRVMKEKGIEDAIEGIKLANKQLGRIVFTLDIYGQIWEPYKEQFREIIKTVPSYIQYKGVVPYNKSVETISKYIALMFPTYYEGEGFAGTLVDAMAAGVPVIASNWKYNKEIIIDEKTGILINDCDANKIAMELIKIAKQPDRWNAMKMACLEEAKKYDANTVYEKLIQHIRI